MLDALVNFAVLNVALMVIATIVGVYAVFRLASRVKTASDQVDAHTQEQLNAIDQDRAHAHESTDIHSRV
jgi:hypothetical protein